MKVGFFSPLPPARTGVADYSAALLGALRRKTDIDIAPRHSDVNLYHLGNNQIHRPIYNRAIAEPGVVVLHDAVLQHFFLGSLTEEQYVEEFAFNYGYWRQSLARELWRNRASSGLNAKYFEYPMLKRIAQASRAVVVHNAAAAELVRAHAPEARVIEIPHLVEPAETPDAADILRFRAGLGIAPEAFLFGVFGYLRESKRVIAILRQFEKLHRDLPHTALLIAGQFVSADLARAAGPLLRLQGIARAGHLNPREFSLAAASVDACINLRYPSAAETSGIAVRLMGMGKPVMLTCGIETDAYPESACFRIESGIAEECALSEHMMLAAAFPETAREVGRQGARHIREYHAPERVAELYWETLCQSRA
ncbi:MAG: glycosyltransferase [Acidobacteriota bacterium]|nr:glycosyltransferase [Acidobacteriota bacterium]